MQYSSIKDGSKYVAAYMFCEVVEKIYRSGKTFCFSHVLKLCGKIIEEHAITESADVTFVYCIINSEISLPTCELG